MAASKTSSRSEKSKTATPHSKPKSSKSPTSKSKSGRSRSTKKTVPARRAVPETQKSITRKLTRVQESLTKMVAREAELAQLLQTFSAPRVEPVTVAVEALAESNLVESGEPQQSQL